MVTAKERKEMEEELEYYEQTSQHSKPASHEYEQIMKKTMFQNIVVI
jgi:hypothetical protein